MEPTPEPPLLTESQEPKPSIRWQGTGLVLALLAIAGSVTFILVSDRNDRAHSKKSDRPNRMIEIVARYAVGTKGLMQMGGQWQPALIEPMLADMGSLTRGDEDALRALLLRSWLTDVWPDEGSLNTLAAKSTVLSTDIATLRKMKAGQGAADEAEWKQLHQRHGWMAELARAQTHSKEHESKQVITRQGISTAIIVIGATMLGLMAGAGGLVLLILGIVRWRRGQIVFSLKQRSHAEGGVLIEGFSIYLALFMLLPLLTHLSPVPLPRWAAYLPATLAVLLGMFWPRIRGMQKSAWHETLGLHRGEGVLREMGLGIASWLAALPLIVVGMIAATWIMKLTGSQASHPIVDEFAGDNLTRLSAVLLAVVWAPITEEIMFRGLLFPGMAAWLRWVAGILMAAFIFAVIHPQGWAGVPPIMALAGTFSLLRLWRQSLIAPMTAHALNNGMVSLMLLLIW